MDTASFLSVCVSLPRPWLSVFCTLPCLAARRSHALIPLATACSQWRSSAFAARIASALAAMQARKGSIGRDAPSMS